MDAADRKLTLYDLLTQVAPSKTWDSLYDSIDDIFSSSNKRSEYHQKFGWSIPSRTAIREIKLFAADDNILEVGAGTGLWARLLKDAFVPIYATDNKSHHTWLWLGKHAPKYTKVERITGKNAVVKYRKANVLMLCWPPYSEPLAFECLTLFQGSKLVYIGEREGGCTASDAFFDLLESEWNLVKTVDIPQWPALHDAMYLYERKSK